MSKKWKTFLNDGMVTITDFITPVFLIFFIGLAIACLVLMANELPSGLEAARIYYEYMTLFITPLGIILTGHYGVAAIGKFKKNPLETVTNLAEPPPKPGNLSGDLEDDIHADEGKG